MKKCCRFLTFSPSLNNMDTEIIKLLTQYGGGALIIYLIILLIKELGKYKKNNNGDIEKLSHRIDKMEGNDLHTIGEDIKYLRGEVDELKKEVADLDKRITLLERVIK